MKLQGAGGGKQGGEMNGCMHRRGTWENIAKASRANVLSVQKKFSAVFSSWHHWLRALPIPVNRTTPGHRLRAGPQSSVPPHSWHVPWHSYGSFKALLSQSVFRLSSGDRSCKAWLMVSSLDVATLTGGVKARGPEEEWKLKCTDLSHTMLCHLSRSYPFFKWYRYNHY